MRQKKYNKELSNLKVLFLFIFLFSLVSTSASGNFSNAKNNESIQASTLILSAERCLTEMQNREINILRANESLQQALQLYSAQVALEEKRTSADYKLVNQFATEVCHVRDIALESQDEMIIFDKTWDSESKNFDLSSIKNTYDEINNSFIQERFEETITLINKGYLTLSNYESSQTTLNLFYKTTTKTIKDFFINNWKILSIGATIVIILLIIFWSVIKKAIIKNKLKNLYSRKSAIEGLVKKIQYDYFKKKTMSETEYNIKIKTFGDMTREIDRQLPEIQEQLIKVDKKKILADEKESKTFKKIKVSKH